MQILTFNASTIETLNDNISNLKIGGLRFAGGNYTISGNTISGTLTVQVTNSGATDTINDSVTLASAPASITVASSSTLNLNGAIGESGGSEKLTKLGAGTLTLAGSNFYSGGTAVQAGTLTVAASGSLTQANGTITITGGTLNTSVAAFSVGGGVTLSSGAIALNGATPATMTLGSGKAFSMSGGTLDLTLGTSFSQIASSGGGTLSISGGSLSLNVTGAGFSYGDTYQVFSGFNSGTVSDLSITGYDSADYTAELSDSGQLSFSAVPEPSSYALIAGGLALGFGVFRRQRQAA